MNESQSTFLATNNPGFQKQIDCLSNLQVNAETSSMKKRNVGGTFCTEKQLNNTEKTRTGANTGTVISAVQPDQLTTMQSVNSKFNMNKNKEKKEKKAKLKIYNELSDYFNGRTPTNPLSYIDNFKQKVMINPGVPYISTSQNEIFERRNFLFQKEYLNKINPFIAAPKEEEKQSIYDRKEEETFI